MTFISNLTDPFVSELHQSVVPRIVPLTVPSFEAVAKDPDQFDESVKSSVKTGLPTRYDSELEVPVLF